MQFGERQRLNGYYNARRAGTTEMQIAYWSFDRWLWIGQVIAFEAEHVGLRVETKPLKIVLKREDETIVADTPERPGSVPTGYGADFYEALGRWLHNNRDAVGVEIDVDPSAMADELARRHKELGER